jgi:mono/diheme cytochrome c family protein
VSAARKKEWLEWARPTGRRLRRSVLLGLVALVVTVLCLKDHLLPESSPAARGYLAARKAGCFSCHGTGAESVPNPLRPAALARQAAGSGVWDFEPVPALLAGNDEATVLRQWIAEGISERSARSAAHQAKRERQSLQMPAYKQRLSAREIDEIVVYLMLARAAARPPSVMPEGERLARSLGCFACHGELGQGGVENPASLKGYVPGFFGRDFEILTGGADREQVKEWIRDGVTRELLEAGLPVLPLGRWILERQAIAMPAYGSLLSEEQIDTLADYLLELHRLGPLGVEHLEPLRRRPAVTPEAGTAPAIAERPVSFVRSIQPILESRCVHCHGPKTHKSGYRLDTRDAAIRSGTIGTIKGRPSIVPGAAASSLFMEFVECKKEDDEQEIYPMPPLEEGSLRPEQIELLRAWIDEDLDWPPGAVLRERRTQHFRAPEDSALSADRR